MDKFNEEIVQDDLQQVDDDDTYEAFMPREVRPLTLT